MLKTLFTDTAPTSIIGCLALMLLGGFLLSRLTKLVKLPNVTGYIIAGILLGPYLLNIASDTLLSGFGFLTDIALAFIAFGVGRYFKLSSLKRNGGKVIALTLFESLAAAVVITLTMLFVFKLPVNFSLLLGAIGCATAPASTMMTIKQYKAKGPFIDTLISVIALDDAVAIIAFNVCLMAVSGGSGVTAKDILLPLAYNVGAVGAGIGLGLLLKVLLSDRFSKDSRLILTLTFILCLTAVCCLLGISPLLSCMAMGAAYVNAGGSKETFKVVGRFSPPVLLLFFVYSGMNLNLKMLLTVGVIGLVYFFVRIAGKYLGALLGGVVTRASPEVKKYFGLALIPQAGVSIGLAAIAARTLSPELGSMLSAIILSSAVLYELIGPALAKLAIFKSKSVPAKKNSAQTEAISAAGSVLPAEQTPTAVTAQDILQEDGVLPVPDASAEVAAALPPGGEVVIAAKPRRRTAKKKDTSL